jgi:NAD(P)-dependent dehydrogenase (short-subunit alcohol dehydrogenase family)
MNSATNNSPLEAGGDRGKTVIITGGNGNLGLAVTKKFLDGGYNVIVTVINEEAKKDLPLHKNLQAEVVNLTSEAETAAFITSVINKYKKIDAALMLVGGFAAGNIDSTGGEVIAKQISLNFETAYYTSRPLFQHMMVKGQGRLVYIGSRLALDAKSGKDLLAYALSKSLLFKLADFLNEEARGKNVTATVVVPSTIDTPLNRKNMPGVDPADWVKPGQIADVLELVTSERGLALRETVLKVYNNS